MKVKKIMGSELTTDHRLVIGPFDYGITEIEDIGRHMLWVTIDTGYSNSVWKDRPINVLDTD